jgi:chromosome segregation ATPase
LNRGHELQGRLDSAKELEKNLMQQASRLLSERDETKEKLQSTDRQLAEVQSREKSLSAEIAKALIERNVLADKLKVLDDMKRDIDLYREK